MQDWLDLTEHNKYRELPEFKGLGSLVQKRYELEIDDCVKPLPFVRFPSLME
jgi:hypothetical protein